MLISLTIKMDVCITTWRYRIRTFSLPGQKGIFRCKTLNVCGSTFLRLTLCLSVLLIIGGTERNPGLTGRSSNRTTSNRQKPARTSIGSIASSQSLLHAYDSGNIRLSRAQRRADTDGGDFNIVDTLISVRMDMNMNINMTDRKSSLKMLNVKLDTISDTCKTLKIKNKLLKEQNKRLCEKVDDLEYQKDSIEGQSRRNNLIFDGIKGRVHEY